MIISHKHKFIFIKNRKTAGTSHEIALSTLCGPDDIITSIDPKDEEARKELGGTSPQNFKLPLSRHSWYEKLGLLIGEDRKSYYNHISAQEVKDYIGEEVWNSYYKFCFERNPWDKVLSQYNARGGAAAFGSVKGHIAAGELARFRGFDMYTIKGNVAVDDILRYEDMDAGLARISEKLNLTEPLSMPRYKAKGDRRKDRRPYQEVFTEEEKEMVAVIFAREIKLLGYEF